MYPRISDFINHLLGTNINIPFQSYGFMLAMAFLAGAWVLFSELRRKEKNGSIPVRKKKIRIGAPATFWEIFFSGIFGFLLGWKGIGLILDYSLFSKNPQEYILSGQGSLVGAIVLAAGFAFFAYYPKKRKQLKEPVWEEVTVHPYHLTGNILLIAAVFGIIGSKIFDLIEHIGDLFRDPFHALVSFSGLSFYGGLIVGSIAVVWYAHRNRIRLPHIADALAPALILAYAVGRIGCQLAGDGCWGIVNAMPKPQWMGFLPDWIWAFRYPHNVINYGIPIPGFSGEHCFILEQPVFPTPIYETLMGLMIFIILWILRKKLRVPGYLFCIYLILNGIERFLAETIRINKTYSLFGLQLTQAEIIAVILVILGIAGFFYFKKLQVAFLTETRKEDGTKNGS